MGPDREGRASSPCLSAPRLASRRFGLPSIQDRGEHGEALLFAGQRHLPGQLGFLRDGADNVCAGAGNDLVVDMNGGTFDGGDGSDFVGAKVSGSCISAAGPGCPGNTP
jgi:hypothetical protein